MDEHELILAVKQLAQELGQTPTCGQFRTHVKNGRTHLENSNLRTYTNLLEAAGLFPIHKMTRIDNSIFERNIDKHLESYVPREIPPRAPYPTIAVISDIHWPFENKKVTDKFIEFVRENQPQYVFLNGDAWDFYSHSKFPRSHNIFTPKDEENSAREKNISFWQAIKKFSPKSKCTQMMGNHDIRPMRRVLEVYPEAEDWVKERMNKLFSFEGVETVMDPREERIIGDICIFHGYRGKLGDHRDYTHYNCIVGHTHQPGVVFRRIRNQALWELNSGLAGDPEAKGLTYTPQKITNWVSSFGYVDQYGPRVIIV